MSNEVGKDLVGVGCVENKQYGLSDEQYKQMVSALEGHDIATLKEMLSVMHVADVADFIDMISQEQRRAFILQVKDDFDPEILVKLDPGVKEEIIDLLGVEDSAKAIVSLNTDDAVDVIEDLNEIGQQELLDAIPQKQRNELEEGLSHPEDSAGRLLDRQVVCVPEFWNVGQTIDFLRTEKKLPDEFYEIFTVDPKMKPVGGVMLSRIMRSKRPTLLSDIMSSELKLINSDMDQEEVAFVFRQYGLASAPVVNDEGRMIGVITVDDIVDVIDEEAREDIMHLGGVTDTDLHASFLQTMQSRFPWLLVNLIMAVIASVVIAFFEGEIEKLAALAVLMPIIASMGGNAGTQTLTIAVRSIATKELTMSNALRVVGKEVVVGGLNGLVFAVIVGAIVYLWYADLYLSLIFSVAIVVTLFVAGFAGALIPIGLERVGIDPAVASSVILTTITDVVAFGVFLGLAAIVLLS